MGEWVGVEWGEKDRGQGYGWGVGVEWDEKDRGQDYGWVVGGLEWGEWDRGQGLWSGVRRTGVRVMGGVGGGRGVAEESRRRDKNRLPRAQELRAGLA